MSARGEVEFIYADLITRADLSVARSGWITNKRHGRTVGMVVREHGDWGRWQVTLGRSGVTMMAETRSGALVLAVETLNVYARSDAYSRMYGHMSLTGGHR